MSKIIEATHSTIRNILIFLIVILITLSILLKNGISIDELKIGSFYLERLYLKLDNKIIIQIHKIVIPQNKKNPNPNIKEILDDIKNILKYFQLIELRKVSFKNNNYTLIYKNNIIYMKNNEFEVALNNVDYIDNKIHAIVKEVYIKKYNIYISGNLFYNINSNNILIKADVKYRDINGKFVINRADEKIFFVLKTDSFKDFEPLINEFKLSENLNTWICKNVKAKTYKIRYLKGIATILNKKVKFLDKSISLKLMTKDVKIIFNPKLNPIFAKSMEILYKNKKLEFNIRKPSFEKKHLDINYLYLDGFRKKPLKLHLDFNIKTKFDKDIKKILEAYNINIPILQTKGVADAKVKIDIELKKKKVNFEGDIKLKKSKIKIGEIILPVKKSIIKIKKNIIDISKTTLSNNMFNISVDGKIYPKKSKAKFNLDIKSIKDKKNLFHIKDANETLSIDYKKNIIFNLSNFESKIQYNKKDKSISIDILDINKIKSYIDATPLELNSGSLVIESKDFNSYNYSGILGSSECFFYTNENSCLSIIPITGVAKSDRLTLNAFDNKLIYNSAISTISLNNLNLDLAKLFETYENKSKKKTNKSDKIKLVGNNSKIRYKEYKLLTDKYIVNIDKKGNFYFSGSLGKDRIFINKNNKFFTIKAKNISDKMLHPLINFNGLQLGKYTINILKNQENITKGVIKIDGGIMRDFQTYNNIMAFINTIPSLATLHKPGFSKYGFRIKKGSIDFTLDGDILKLKSILIKGASATISGSGIVNLKTKKIKVDLIIMTAREVSQMIKNLPIVGDIIMGDKHSVSVGLKVRGSLNKVKIKVSAVEDLMLLPIDIIKRTLSTPFNMYKKAKNKSIESRDNNLDMY